MKFRLKSGLAIAAISASLMLSTSATGQGSDANSQREQGRSGMIYTADRPANYELDQYRRMDKALAGLKPQRKGTVDAYVLVAGFDSDPVFGREVLAARDVLSARYDAVGRTIAIGAGEEPARAGLANGSPDHLAIALGRIAEVMDKKEDVLVLYSTSHGSPYSGIAFQDKYLGQGFGAVGPERLAKLVNDLGITNRVLIISACYSGIFVPALASDTTVIATAASKDRSSFGCNPGNDWTFFGDAMINNALRKPQGIQAAFNEANGMITGWEGTAKIKPSQPQFSMGKSVGTWLTPLETRMPKTASKPVGRPSFATSLGG